MRKDQISIQLYTIRSITATDWDVALGHVAEAGYKAVEFAGFQGKTATEIRGLLDKLRIACLQRPHSAHAISSLAWMG